MRCLLVLAAAAVLAATACTQIAEAPSPAVPVAAADAAKPAEKAERQPVWLGSEASVFEHVQKTYEDAGFPEVRTAVFKVSEEVPLPFYNQADRTLYIAPFSDGVDKMRARLARMSASHFSGALTFIDAFDSADTAYEAYRAFLTVAVAHELGHHIQFLRKPAGTLSPADIYDIESEAIELEQAFLAQQIETKQVPARWRDHYRLSVLAIRDSIPAHARETLPEDDKALRDAFARAYLTYGRGEAGAEGGVNVEISAAAVVYAGYTRKRMALLVKSGRSLAELAAAETRRRAGAN